MGEIVKQLPLISWDGYAQIDKIIKAELNKYTLKERVTK
jgi:hypothetical protein